MDDFMGGTTYGEIKMLAENEARQSGHIKPDERQNTTGRTNISCTQVIQLRRKIWEIITKYRHQLTMLLW